MRSRQDQRVRRTRAALVEAFNRLALRGRPRTIRVADIVAEAGVGRSTFYDHYAGAEAIHVDALARPFAVLAEAASGDCEPERLARLLAHFWEYRARARATLAPPMGAKAARLLADLVEARLAERGAETAIPRRLAAVQLADAAMAPVRAWVMAEAPCTAEKLAESLCRSGAQLAAALGAEKGVGH
jgi:AcrR family transcriptional regulator